MNDWWMVLDRSNERIVYRSASALEAFRLARRSVGGAARMTAAPGFGISVTGRRGTVTVIRVPRNPTTQRRRVAIPVTSMDRAEQVQLPDGSRFTWIPAEPSRFTAIPATTPAHRRSPAPAGRSKAAR